MAGLCIRSGDADPCPRFDPAGLGRLEWTGDYFLIFSVHYTINPNKIAVCYASLGLMFVIIASIALEVLWFYNAVIEGRQAIK